MDILIGISHSISTVVEQLASRLVTGCGARAQCGRGATGLRHGLCRPSPVHGH